MRTSIFFTVMALGLADFTSFGVSADSGSWTGWSADANCAVHVGCAKLCIKNGGKWAVSMPDGVVNLVYGAERLAAKNS